MKIIFQTNNWGGKENSNHIEIENSKGVAVFIDMVDDKIVLTSHSSLTSEQTHINCVEIKL